MHFGNARTSTLANLHQFPSRKRAICVTRVTWRSTNFEHPEPAMLNCKLEHSAGNAPTTCQPCYTLSTTELHRNYPPCGCFPPKVVLVNTSPHCTDALVASQTYFITTAFAKLCCYGFPAINLCNWLSSYEGCYESSKLRDSPIGRALAAYDCVVGR